MGSRERGNPGRPRGRRHARTPLSQTLGHRAARFVVINRPLPVPWEASGTTPLSRAGMMALIMQRRIFLAAPLAAAYPLAPAEPEPRVHAFGDGIPHTPGEYAQLLATRSEERRVGKECR